MNNWIQCYNGYFSKLQESGTSCMEKMFIGWFGFDNKNVKISNLDFISHEFDLIVYMLSFEKEMH